MPKKGAGHPLSCSDDFTAAPNHGGVGISPCCGFCNPLLPFVVRPVGLSALLLFPKPLFGPIELLDTPKLLVPRPLPAPLFRLLLLFIVPWPPGLAGLL